MYLAAFEAMAADNHVNLTPATLVDDEPTTFKDGDNDYTPANYQNEYDGPITLRHALALSRNIVAIKVAETTGYDKVANLWQRVGVGTPAKPYPSIALGVFEASPIEMTEAYTLFTNGGDVRPLQAITELVENGKPQMIAAAAKRPVARPDTTFLVTNMMRSVIDEGTGAGARSAGFTRDAAGKTGTTNDLRDAWFIGFTPDLLTAVWVGFDNNQPIGLSGGQAALPIWTTFMKRAMAGAVEHDVRDAARRRLRRHRQGDGRAGHAQLPARHPRGLPGRHRADGHVPRARRRAADVFQSTGQLLRPGAPLTGRSGPVSAGGRYG